MTSTEESERQRRPRVPTERIEPAQRIKQPDGPWIAHPDLICDDSLDDTPRVPYAPNISMDEYRGIWKAHQERTEGILRGGNEDVEILYIVTMAAHVDMSRWLGCTDHEIASAVEREYVGAHQYLVPGALKPPAMVERFAPDWRLNARGIYYRHYYSPAWTTADHSLWVPLPDEEGWNDRTEEQRTRTNTFLRHVLDNEKWNKSEYAWEADAWSDVFGRMRDDPSLAVDKHEYNAIRNKGHPVSCMMSEESAFVKRIPDATFGLATSQPRDYPSALAEWDLDRDRLEALLVYRHCGLISDPRWGDTNLVFPFAAYEAKGWSGDPREARRQACSAGAAYLDILDDLARQPGNPRSKTGAYQTPQSRNSQVFVFTSFGAHWHVLVGYKGPRLRSEYAGYEGVSGSVYVFQRIWSGRVTTERRAWELLSLVDQIHLWGFTDFRDFVIGHLKPWHEFGKKCYVNDVNFMELGLDPGSRSKYETTPGERIQGVRVEVPVLCIQLPEWTKNLTEDARRNLMLKAAEYCQRAYAASLGVTTSPSCLLA